MKKNRNNGTNSKKKFIIIDIIIFVMVIFVIVIVINARFNINDNSKVKGNKNSNVSDVSFDDSVTSEGNINFKNLKHAKIIDGEKVCVSGKLKNIHYIRYYDNNKKSILTSSNAKIYTVKKENLIYAEIPITNSSDEEFIGGSLEVDFVNDQNSYYAIYSTIHIDALKPHETTTIKVDSGGEDITNSLDYVVYIDGYKVRQYAEK